MKQIFQSSEMGIGLASRPMNIYSQPHYAISAAVISAIIAGVAAATSTTVAATQANKQQKRMESAVAGKGAVDESHYLYQKNVSSADTSRGRNLLRIAQEQSDRNWKRAQGAAAVGGGTDASVAMEKEKGNKMMADTLATLASEDTQRMDKAEDMKATADGQNIQMQANLAQQKSQNVMQLGAGISNSLMQAGALAANYFDGKANAASPDAAGAGVTETPSETTSQPKTDVKPDAVTPKTADEVIKNKLIGQNNEEPKVKSFSQTADRLLAKSGTMVKGYVQDAEHKILPRGYRTLLKS